MFETAYEVLSYAEEELERALKARDMFLYRNAADKAFLALIIAVNEYLARKVGVVPRSHSERRRLLREIGREDVRALYSDIMRTLHDEALYEGVFNPDDVKYAISKVRELIGRLKAEVEGSSE